MDEKEENDLREELGHTRRERTRATWDFIKAKEDLYAMTEKAKRLEQALEVIAQDNESWTSSYAKQVLAGHHPAEILVELIKGTMRSRTREWPGTGNEK